MIFALVVLTIPLGSRETLAQTSPGEGFAVIFSSGRAGNNDIFILRPGEREPVNLTRHPARDLCPAAQGPGPADHDRADVPQAAHDCGEGCCEVAADRVARGVLAFIIMRGVRRVGLFSPPSR